MFADVKRLLIMQKYPGSNSHNTNDAFIYITRFDWKPHRHVMAVNSKIYLPLTNHLFFPPSSQGLNF